ncbi:hypothetical protein E1B28_006682 [Marasmius oreades]|uniref:Uncharacterized protein n=1 Tax=Marasmius oreades TaxID=181124 RepID=A0A9P8AB29_9AGAR|nr:uncharacterized protein E1B28_006682 [Marasmius oreades]KAG7096000.1 hypothetical protein E1B28_006682 [Marasmius oreades]
MGRLMHKLRNTKVYNSHGCSSALQRTLDFDHLYHHHRTLPMPPTKAADKPPTRNGFIKKYWGNRLKFQDSYGLGRSFEDFEEGNMILDELLKLERERWEEETQSDAGRR